MAVGIVRARHKFHLVEQTEAGAPLLQGLPALKWLQLPAQPPASAQAPACRDFQRGACTRGASCRFSHIAATPAPIAAPAAPPPSKGGKGGYGKGAGTSQNDCAFWVAFGTCNHGSNCVYQHRPEKRNAGGGQGAPPASPFN